MLVTHTTMLNTDTLPWPTLFCLWAIQLSTFMEISRRFCITSSPVTALISFLSFCLISISSMDHDRKSSAINYKLATEQIRSLINLIQNYFPVELIQLYICFLDNLNFIPLC